MFSAGKSGRDSFPSISGTDRLWLVSNIKSRFSVKGRTVLVTSAARGIGRACAVAFAQSASRFSTMAVTPQTEASV